jgi:hypothetical protein
LRQCERRRRCDHHKSERDHAHGGFSVGRVPSGSRRTDVFPMCCVPELVFEADAGSPAVRVDTVSRDLAASGGSSRWIFRYHSFDRLAVRDPDVAVPVH